MATPTPPEDPISNDTAPRPDAALSLPEITGTVGSATPYATGAASPPTK